MLVRKFYVNHTNRCLEYCYLHIPIKPNAFIYFPYLVPTVLSLYCILTVKVLRPVALTVGVDLGPGACFTKTIQIIYSSYIFRHCLIGIYEGFELVNV